MRSATPQQQVELFHLLFTRHLAEKVDRSLFVLKGGCNLRFYFKSIRYSEDIDFDVQTVAKETLKSQVSRLLASSAFEQVLRSRKLGISDVTAPKQTETTQRWKLKVSGPASALALPTKIEFSRRGLGEERVYEAVDPELVAAYALYPVLCTHYACGAAYKQKLSALIHRTETQARDVFDLDLLLSRASSAATKLAPALQAKLGQAIDNCMSISYDDYRSQVVSYLDPSYQKHFGSRQAWNRMQEKLVATLEALQGGAAP